VCAHQLTHAVHTFAAATGACAGKLGVIASEEEDHPVLVEEAFSSKYVAVFDPLDGSSNIDAAISTGTAHVLILNLYCTSSYS
jgi:fructose-1,6-bisphosphatase